MTSPTQRGWAGGLTRGRMSRCLLALSLLALSQIVAAGPIRERIMERKAEKARDDAVEEAGSGPAPLPVGVQLIGNVAYGSATRQRFDVYKPANAHGAPVVFMVHGGAWWFGDKAMSNVVNNKLARWAPKGIVFVSVNYRMVPEADPLEQARDVARALAAAQEKAVSWGADRSKFVLVGHSAGAHLVSLLAASPSIATGLGATPWLGTVSLDSAAMDIERVMEKRHPGFYDRAFGADPAYWRSASPYHLLKSAGAPMLLVCSSKRADNPCGEATRFAAKASSLGMRVQVLEEAMTHKEIDKLLGEKADYTQAVETFLISLDGALAERLTGR